ncbi:MAG: hypothetical protein Q4B91_02410 [Atopobiaceae bacterium]|nr:hypothetical protein [Atopobiaceae bacterium]
MSSECKVVKGLSWLIMLIGLASAVMGVVMLMGARDAGVQTAAVIMIVAAVFEFVTGVTGARGANNPAHLGGFIVFAAIVALVNVAEIVLIVTGGQGTVWINAIYVAAALVAIVCASRAKRAALDR